MKTPVIVALAALVTFACENDKAHEGTVTAERSQAIVGPKEQPAVATPVSAPAPAPAAPAKPRRALCGGHLEADGRTLSKKSISRRAAPGASELPAEPSYTGLTWVNFWAAWCVPCKEEIPRLLAWQERLKGQGKGFKVVFVSLDDDERQLTNFLAAQPENGLRATYWLHEGKEREDWLAGAGVDPDPDLPQHLLVDAKGKVRCRVRGAVDDADFDGLKALLKE